MTTTTAVERLHRDLFPCDVTLNGGVIALQARVFITSNRVLIYGARERVVRHVRTAFITGEAPQRNRGTLAGHLEVETDQGTMLVNRSHGCGCGSPLRALARPVTW